MNDFVASNGRRLWIDDRGSVRGEFDEHNTVTYVRAENFEMLREFFRAEADERLGRWRDPEDTVFVVYSGGAWDGVYSPIRVVAETNGASWLLDREDHEPNVPATVLAVARRYFDAHPEPKPWHDAKPGQVWILKFGEDVLDEGAYVAGDTTFIAADHGVPIDDHRVIAGRRIWPGAVS